MTLLNLVITLAIILAISILANVLLWWYLRDRIVKIFTASEEVSEIFSMIDAYEEHLQSVYEMPTFYGDSTLQGLLEHTKEMVGFLKKYEEVYSFTQPDLEEQLLAASKDITRDAEEEKTNQEI
jgi:hypothetical protein